MITEAVAAFVGALAALVILEVTKPIVSRALRYAAALVGGILLAVVLSWGVQVVVGLFHKVNAGG